MKLLLNLQFKMFYLILGEIILYLRYILQFYQRWKATASEIYEAAVAVIEKIIFIIESIH